ncbi:MAG TPA: biotin transporter BioY [Gemmatimonadales bacterium]|jgi:biotin transport system substrate-specific component
MTRVATASVSLTRIELLRRAAALVAGVVLVALSAQFAVPLPGTPVPVTFQVCAVLIVGGLLGPRFGAMSLGLYLLLGAAGLPVFQPLGVPGAARLIGPTGGYLLAYPLAAAAVGALVGDARHWGRLLGGLVAGALIIHLGGVSQLAILSGGMSQAIAMGSVPFLLGDALKVALAALVVRRLAAATRALR